jgi:hypothetical protein
MLHFGRGFFLQVPYVIPVRSGNTGNNDPIRQKHGQKNTYKKQEIQLLSQF